MLFQCTVSTCNFGLFFTVQGLQVAVGTHKGLVQIWDASSQKKLVTLEGHSARVGRYPSDSRLIVACNFLIILSLILRTL